MATFEDPELHTFPAPENVCSMPIRDEGAQGGAGDTDADNGANTGEDGGGSSFNAGINQDNQSVIGSGNDTVEITQEVNDPPIIQCSTNLIVNNDPGQCSAEVTYTGIVTDDSSGIASVTCTHNGTSTTQTFPTHPVNVTYTMTETFPVGITTVTCTATDAAGAVSAPCSFTVTVIDNERPVIICPPDITVFNDPGRNGAIVHFPNPAVSDNCPGVVTACTPATGSFFARGSTTVTCTATDAAGNTSICSFKVKVIVDPCRFFSGGCCW